MVPNLPVNIPFKVTISNIELWKIIGFLLNFTLSNGFCGGPWILRDVADGRSPSPFDLPINLKNHEQPYKRRPVLNIHI